jgi:uncharacterized membrane protein
MTLTNIPWPLLIAAVLPVASIAVIALITPRLTRPDIFFAVTVSPCFRKSPAGRGILHGYYGMMVAISLLALVLMALTDFRSPSKVALGLRGPLVVEMIGLCGAFLVARHRTLPYHTQPTAQREAGLQPRQISLPGSWPAQAGPFLILGAVCLCLILRWDSIPAQVPIHWGLNDRPDEWAARSPAAVFGCAATGLLVCVFISGLWFTVVRGVRQIYSRGERALGQARFIRAMSIYILGVEYWLALLMGLLSLAQLRTDLKAPLPLFWPILACQTVLIVAIVVIALRMGQGGWRLGAREENGTGNDNAPPVGDRTPDECWKLGLLYFNPNDPALFVEKRFGVGWTLNFANAKSWLIIGALLLFLAASLGLAFFIAKGAHGTGK